MPMGKSKPDAVHRVRPARSLPLGLVQSALCFVDGLLPTFALLVLNGLFPRPFKFAALLFRS